MSQGFDSTKESQQYLNFKNEWLAAHKKVVATQSIEQIVQSIKMLENNSIFSNQMIIVYKTQDFTPLYVTKNIEKMMGFSQEEYFSWGASAFFKRGLANQSNYFPNLLKWENHFKKFSPFTKIKSKGRIHICGKSFQHKDGSTKRFLLRQEFNVEVDSIIPAVGVLYYEDITHLIKGEEYWLLLESFANTSSFSKFYKKDGIDNYPITSREKEILILIAKGKSTKEVASELKISPDTVGQHRKNMIKRMMAKDTSALIQLCKMCTII